MTRREQLIKRCHDRLQDIYLAATYDGYTQQQLRACQHDLEELHRLDGER